MINPALYHILCYHNGRGTTPEIHGRTGCWKNACKSAKDIASEGYPATVKNTETGSLTNFDPTQEEQPQ